jgi:hypothetical protein
MFTIESELSWDAVRNMLQETTMLHDSNMYPYRHARISLRWFEYGDLGITSRYVACTTIATQVEIADTIGRQGYDPLNLEGGIVLASQNESGEETLTNFIPPIVEETDKDGVYLINGSHRTNRGRLWLGRTGFLGVHITNIDPDCEAYAYPNAWEEVKIYDRPPRDPALRKDYKPNAAKLYRAHPDGSRPRYTLPN